MQWNSTAARSQRSCWGPQPTLFSNMKSDQSYARPCHSLNFGRRDTYQKITLYYVETAIKGHHKCHDFKGWFLVSLGTCDEIIALRFLSRWYFVYPKTYSRKASRVEMKKRAVIHEKGIGDMSLGSDDCFAPSDAEEEGGRNHQMSTITNSHLATFTFPVLGILRFTFSHSSKPWVTAKVCTRSWSFSTCGKSLKCN